MAARVVTLLRYIIEKEVDLYNFAADGLLLCCEFVQETKEQVWTKERIAKEMLADRALGKSYHAALQWHISVIKLDYRSE